MRAAVLSEFNQPLHVEELEIDEQQSRLHVSGAQPMTTGFLQSLVTQVALTLFASTQQERS